MCSPLSKDHTRSKLPSSKGCCSASATCSTNPTHGHTHCQDIPAVRMRTQASRWNGEGHRGQAEKGLWLHFSPFQKTGVRRNCARRRNTVLGKTQFNCAVGWPALTQARWGRLSSCTAKTKPSANLSLEINPYKSMPQPARLEGALSWQRGSQRSHRPGGAGRQAP